MNRDDPRLLHEGGSPVKDTTPRYIGSATLRPTARRLLQGRGTYLDDVLVPRMAHVVYLRCPLSASSVKEMHGLYFEQLVQRHFDHIPLSP